MSSISLKLITINSKSNLIKTETTIQAREKRKVHPHSESFLEMTEEQRQSAVDKFGIVTVEGHLLTPHNQCFLVAPSEINFSIVGGFQQWKKVR